MKNIQDIRQRDMEYVGDGKFVHISRWNNKPSPPESQNIHEGTSIWFFVLFIVLILLLIGVSDKNGYDAGYKQAKIDYHIK